VEVNQVVGSNTVKRRVSIVVSQEAQTRTFGTREGELVGGVIRLCASGERSSKIFRWWNKQGNSKR
jgi:hypothetical protein